VIEFLVCLIVGISDGDTLKARCGEPGAYQQVTIRLAEIDAPEKGQAFGQRSKQSLSALCYGVQAVLRPVTRDRYGRTVARAECNNLDASAEQIRRGMAWRFVRYSTDPAMQPLEDAARNARTGLWADPTPVAPWEFRRLRRDAGAAPIRTTAE
jgi:endonuclease YncB( thermonuclease family)